MAKFTLRDTPIIKESNNLFSRKINLQRKKLHYDKFKITAKLGQNHKTLKPE